METKTPNIAADYAHHKHQATLHFILEQLDRIVMHPQSVEHFEKEVLFLQNLLNDSDFRDFATIKKTEYQRKEAKLFERIQQPKEELPKQESVRLRKRLRTVTLKKEYLEMLLSDSIFQSIQKIQRVAYKGNSACS